MEEEEEVKWDVQGVNWGQKNGKQRKWSRRRTSRRKRRKRNGTCWKEIRNRSEKQRKEQLRGRRTGRRLRRSRWRGIRRSKCREK